MRCFSADIFGDSAIEKSSSHRLAINRLSSKVKIKRENLNRVPRATIRPHQKLPSASLLGLSSRFSFAHPFSDFVGEIKQHQKQQQQINPLKRMPQDLGKMPVLLRHACVIILWRNDRGHIRR